jgi:hypothetical protein
VTERFAIDPGEFPYFGDIDDAFTGFALVQK